MKIDLEELLQTEDTQENKISFADIKKVVIDYASYIWSKKWVLLAAGIVGVIIGVINAFIYKPTYTATYKFSIESKSSAGSCLSALNLLAGIN